MGDVPAGRPHPQGRCDRQGPRPRALARGDGDGVASRGGALADAGTDALRRPTETVPLADVHLLAPIPEPPSVQNSIGYLDHVRNTRHVTGGPPLEPV